ncbi:hypothetical protein E3O55_15430 [Cryobacterium sp. MDB1-18-2]|nr:hypothetical protein E3O55_15430 [Cryobacterium sp. MDB1-18-2]TFC42056.1 hypothetical protein E3O50_09190 [Cryobacterium sp. MDB1-18-1]
MDCFPRGSPQQSRGRLQEFQRPHQWLDQGNPQAPVGRHHELVAARSPPHSNVEAVNSTSSSEAFGFIRQGCIDDTNRLVYYVTDDHIVILQVREHY